MRANLFTRLFLLATLVGSGGYVVLYLWRWEWNRALISGLFFLAAEGALLAGGLARRLRRLEDELRALRTERAGPTGPAVDAARAHLVDTRPAPADRFEWLRSSAHRTNVFVPVLMGAGVLLSGVAWLVEKVARSTARPALERRLARRVAPLLYVAPEGGLVPPTAAAAVVPRALRPGRS